MKRILLLASIAGIALAQVTAGATTVKAAPPDDGVTVKGFRLDGMKTLKEMALDKVPEGPPLDKLMTKEEMDSTGVSRLSATEKATLEKWVGKILYFTTLRAYHDARQGLNTRTAHRPRKIYHYHLQAAPSMLSEELAVEYARMTFSKEGQKVRQWELTRADNPPSKAPDGTADKYFDRFSFRPTEGRVHFTNGTQTRTAQVRMEGQWVVCWVFFGM